MLDEFRWRFVDRAGDRGQSNGVFVGATSRQCLQSHAFHVLDALLPTLRRPEAALVPRRAWSLGVR
jgi:hypothetical protein